MESATAIATSGIEARNAGQPDEAEARDHADGRDDVGRARGGRRPRAPRSRGAGPCGRGRRRAPRSPAASPADDREAEVEAARGAGRARGRGRRGRRSATAATAISAPFDARGEELDLAVAVGMVAVGGPRRDDERVEQQRRRDDVHDRLEGVGEQRRRARAAGRRRTCRRRSRARRRARSSRRARAPDRPGASGAASLRAAAEAMPASLAARLARVSQPATRTPPRS